MKEFIIEENEAGQRFDKYLAKLLREAPKSFFYKMLRKKNISRCVVPVAEIDRTDCASVQQEMNMCRRDEIPVPAGIVL